MKKVIISLTILASVTLLLFIRFYKLGNLPGGVFIDEANFGGEALSILQTGRDTWGERFPLSFRGFGEYKAPGYIYSMVPLIALRGLDTLTTRLPSALSGIISILFFFLILRQLLPKRPLQIILFITFIFALSPWHIALSRYYYEPFVALPFLAIGIYAKLKKKLGWQIVSAICLSLTGYFYPSLRYVAAGVFGWGIILDYIAVRKLQFLPTLLFLAFSLGWIGPSLSHSGITRLNQEVGKYTLGRTLVINEHRAYCHLVTKNILIKAGCHLEWNKPVEYGYTVVRAAISQWGPGSLYLSSPDAKLLPSNQGLFSLTLLPIHISTLIFLGYTMRRLLRRRKTNFDQAILYLCGIAVLAAVPGSVVGQTSVHRFIGSLYVLSLISGVAMIRLWDLRATLHRHVYGSVILVWFGFFALDTSRFVLDYFTTYSYGNPVLWQEDSRQIYTYLKENGQKYKHIFDRSFAGPVEGLFYGYLSPQAYQTDIERDIPNSDGWSHARRVGNLVWGGDSVVDSLCLRTKLGEPTYTLIIDTPSDKLAEYAIFSTHSFNKVHILHQIYDVDRIYNELSQEPGQLYLRTLCPLAYVKD